MHRSTWKKGESRIAKLFGTSRTPLSGGNSKHTRSDTLHEVLFIEVKHRRNLPQQKLWEKTLDEAKKENKTPLIVFIKKSCPDPVVFCKLSQLGEISKHLNTTTTTTTT